MRNWRNSVTSSLNTRCSPYPYITPVLFTLLRTQPYIQRGRVKKKDYMIRGNSQWERCAYRYDYEVNYLIHSSN